jgi:hypothetical protein
MRNRSPKAAVFFYDHALQRCILKEVPSINSISNMCQVNYRIAYHTENSFRIKRLKGMFFS